MSHKKHAVAVVFLCVASAVAQTPADFEEKYGKPDAVYQVTEHIWMTPEYTTDGQVCLIRVHPRRFSQTANYISPNLPFHELMRVLNDRVPPQTRGAEKLPFNTGAAGGGADWLSYAYVNMRFLFVASFRPEPDSWKTRKEYVFSIGPESAPAEPPKLKDSAPSDNDFSPSQLMNIEMVTINWHGRQCSSQ